MRLYYNKDMFQLNNDTSKPAPFTYSLRSRLLLLLVVMLLPLILFSVYQAYLSYEQLTKQILTDNARDAKEVGNNIDELIQSTADLLVAISSSRPAQEQNFGELKQWFGAVAKEYPYYKNIIYVDLDGNIRAAASTFTKKDGKIIANVGNTAYYKRSLTAEGLAYGDFMLGILSNKPVIHITYPVEREGEKIAFVAIAFDLARLQERIVTSNITEGSEITVFDQNGTVIARTLNPSQWVGKCFKSSDIFTAATGGEKNITAPGPDGIVRLMTFQKTETTPWVVTVCFNESSIRNLAVNNLLKELTLFVPLLLVALFGWVLIGRDVDKRYKAARRLSMTDPLTSLGSFLKFNHDLEQDIARAKHNMQSMALLLVDVRGLREMKQGVAYEYGNEVLIGMADIIRNNLRDTDSAYRFDSDEISVLLSSTDELDAYEFAQHLVDEIAVSDLLKKHDWNEKLDIAIGIAVYPLDASSADCIVLCATEALHDAKASEHTKIFTYSQTQRPRKIKESAG